MCSTVCCRIRPAAFADLRARPVIGSLVELAEWDAFCSANDWRGGAALHVDTGMNRLGIAVNDAAALAPRIRAENHGITLLMSHLACADTPAHPLNKRQIDVFREVRVLYRGIPSSLANSSGIFLGNAAHCDTVRPGHRALRRQSAAGPEQSDAAGDPLGRRISCRCATSRAARPSAIPAPGPPSARPSWRWSRSVTPTVTCAPPAPQTTSPAATPLSPASAARWRGASRWIFWRSTSPICPTAPRGAAVLATLIGDEISVDDVAAAAGTIGYEVLTSLGRRYHRIYKSA